MVPGLIVILIIRFLSRLPIIRCLLCRILLMSTDVPLLLIVVVLNSSAMICTEFPYDPVRDLKPVEPFGFIDLASALVSGTVPSQLPDSDSDYNGIDEPGSILGKPRDVFDVMAMQQSINDYTPPADSKNESQ